nr:hypothetical protein [Tanacetum cinerariifolium]
MAANGEKFVIDKISVPINIQLFLKCVIKRRLLDAKVLSKFDLKSGFWQLGIKPEDRPKTTFCIPDHHYQWKVMLFGLKNAPSAFQKAMITIFVPILANTLVYIDDILLFSPDEQSHEELLSKFYSLVTKYRIMLSKKKMEVRVTTIQFLGMEFMMGDNSLNHMLKKNPPQWTSRQTKAAKAIKSLAEKMPPLKIPASSEKESYRQMQVMSVGERSYLFKIIIIKDTFVDTKVARSKHGQIGFHSGSSKSLQSNEALRSSSFI